MATESVAPAGLSVVVPTWRDDAALSRLLAQLATLGPRADELLVVDGADSAATRELASGAGARYLPSPAGRGTQLNRGTRAAGGAVRWFLHADAVVAPHSVAAILRSLEAGAAFERAGGFAESLLFEEVPLVRALQRGGGFRVLETPIAVSPVRLARWHRRLKD